MVTATTIAMTGIINTVDSGLSAAAISVDTPSFSEYMIDTAALDENTAAHNICLMISGAGNTQNINTADIIPIPYLNNSRCITSPKVSLLMLSSKDIPIIIIARKPLPCPQKSAA